MDAYDVEKVQSFKRLGIKIEASTAFGDRLLVVTEGQDLMQYRTSHEYEAAKNKQVLRLNCLTYKVFQKPVSQIRAIPEIDVLLVVSESTLNIHDLADEYKFKFTLPDTKGLTYFDVSIQEYAEAVEGIELKFKVQICVAMGKKLKILEWTGETFEETVSDLVLSKSAKGVLWCDKRIFVAFKNEYLMIKPHTGHIKEVFGFEGGQKHPIMVRISDTMAALQYDTKSVFVNHHGRRANDNVISWTSVPNMLLHDPPYMVAVMARHLEVKSVDPSISIQQMDIKHAINVCIGKDVIFVQTAHSIYTLTHRPRDIRVKHLISNYHFDVAIQIQEQTDMSVVENKHMVRRIQARKAVHLFCKLMFQEAMDVFRLLKTDISHVVGMIPGMLPRQLRNHLEYPERLPSLHGNDMHNAIRALAEYLEEKREILVKQKELEPFTPIWQHKKNETLKTKDQALSVIDTTLLKCYIQVNEDKVRPLLRREDSCVHLTEAEKVLTKWEKYSDLIVLYEHHQLHNKALDVMRAQSGKKKSALYGIEPTIHKLQQLGEENLNLIYAYSSWVFVVDPYEALKIFTEDIPTVRALPRGHILSYIVKTEPRVAIDYLEYVIYEWNDTTQALHIDYAERLREKVQTLYKNYQFIHPGAKLPKARTDKGELGLYRHKFLQFLKVSKYYKPEDVLTRMPLECFFEERAVLLGQMGRHDQALGIYVYILDDAAEAEQYCRDFYEAGDHGVYLNLLKTFLYPPGPLTLGLQDYKVEPKPQMLQALNMLETHPTLINIYKAVEMLPDHMLVKKVGTFLEAAMGCHMSTKLYNEVLKRIQYQHRLQVSVENQVRSKTHVLIDEDTCCAICNMKLGNTVFARYPSGHIVHYGCYRDTNYADFLTSLQEEAETLGMDLRRDSQFDMPDAVEEDNFISL